MKKMILVFVLAATFIGSTGVHASSNSLVNIFYSINEIRINNSTVETEKEPFIFEGTTYVPLRFISESLGEDVSWDGKNRTVHIGNSPDPDAFYIEKDVKHMNSTGGDWLRSIDTQHNSSDVLSDNVGNSYGDYIHFDFYRTMAIDKAWGLIEYPVNENWTEFSSTFGITEYSIDQTIEKVFLDILVDNKKVDTLTLTPGEYPKDVSVDLSKNKKIGFKVRFAPQDTRLDRYPVALFDPKFK